MTDRSKSTDGYPWAFKCALGLSLLAGTLAPSAVHADTPTAKPAYPIPSIYPTTWELKFEHGTPRRIVVTVPGQSQPQAYWYMTYLVTNKTDREQQWLPTFEFLCEDGRVIQSDGKNVPSPVFAAIKEQEKRPLLDPFNKVSGTIRVGDGQAQESVAIWPEPTTRLGHFSIFITGLSGEVRSFKKVDGSLVELKTGADFTSTPKEALVILRKTLQLNFFINGDDVYPGEDVVNEKVEAWVMR